MNPEKRKRSLRSHTKAKRLKQELSEMEDVGHFGADVSSYVKSAMKQGGKLDDEIRHRMHGDIRSNAVRGDTLSEVLPSFMATHIQEHQSSWDQVRQSDMRVNPRGSQDYEGHQITSTHVHANHSSPPDSKQISQPLSPQPHSDVSGGYHRAHASPFSLVGEISNTAQTVWGQSWANISVDGHIEKRALKAANKGHQVYHFRLDTASHSTVGFVKQRRNKTQEFKAFSATYKRR